MGVVGRGIEANREGPAGGAEGKLDGVGLGGNGGCGYGSDGDNARDLGEGERESKGLIGMDLEMIRPRGHMGRAHL